jgi:hypothetical protein
MARRGVLLLKARAHLVSLGIVMVALFMGVGPFFASPASGAQITNRSLKLSNNKPAASAVTYQTTFTIASSGTLGSVRIEFCSNSALIEDTCTAPWGLDALNAILTSQSGPGGFSLSPSSTVNSLILTRVPTNVAAGAASFTFDQIINPTDEGSYYIKIFTYPTTDATGLSTDFGAMAFPITPGFDVNAEVPPYLTFCQGVTIDGFDCSTATGDQIGLGSLDANHTSTATSHMVAATNADNGYAITASGFTMTSGNNIIPAMQSASSVVGTSQFGINLRSNTTPAVGEAVTGPGSGAAAAQYNQLNKFRFANNDQIASASGVQDSRRYTISYVVNVNKDQAPGVYSTTLTYVCVATF